MHEGRAEGRFTNTDGYDFRQVADEVDSLVVLFWGGYSRRRSSGAAQVLGGTLLWLPYWQE
jgi:hypothetical protein